jgi:hypothetical protein
MQPHNLLNINSSVTYTDDEPVLCYHCREFDSLVPHHIRENNTLVSFVSYVRVAK